MIGALKSFEDHPFYSYFAGLMQAKADQAVQSVLSGFQGKGQTAILLREQTIGAAPIYLELVNTVLRVKEEITEYQKQNAN